MNLSENILILGFSLPTLLIFIFAGYIIFLFIVWSESKKDGFPTDRIFDLFIFSTSGSILVLYLYHMLYSWLLIYRYSSFLLKFDQVLSSLLIVYLFQIVCLYISAVINKWSKYRILDIYSYGAAFFLLFLSLGRMVIIKEYEIGIFALLLLIYYLFILRFRGYRVSSGVSFSIFNLILGAYGIIFFKQPGYLIIYPMLFTIGLLSYYFRVKGKHMNPVLPFDFVNKLKNILLTRDKSLKSQQELLTEEDAFLQEGRDTSNAEMMDDAILEDAQKELTDANQGLIAGMRKQIRKALVFMKIGKYGLCEVCGKPIDRARLQIYPEATKCLECAAKSVENK